MFIEIKVLLQVTHSLSSKTKGCIVRESNPGLPRDRRRSSPLDYRGLLGRTDTGSILLNMEIGSNQTCTFPFFAFVFLQFCSSLLGNLRKINLAGKEEKNPSSRIWTSDLWITANRANYSPPLYQLSYRGEILRVVFKHDCFTLILTLISCGSRK